MASARNEFLHIDLTGLERYADQIDRMDDKFKRNLKVAMYDFALYAEEGSRALAPRDEGTLENSIHAVVPKWEGDVLVSGVYSNMEYALKRHEAPYKPGTRDKYDNGVKFVKYYLNGRGRRTYRKPSWKGEKPGRKYMDRAILLIEHEQDALFLEAVEKTFREGTQ